MAPPTINLDNPDDECDLDLVPHVAKAGNFEYALQFLRFGGTNGSLISNAYNSPGRIVWARYDSIGPFYRRDPF